MQSNKVVSFLFAMGEEQDGDFMCEEKMNAALSFGAGNILLILLACSGDAAFRYCLMGRDIGRTGFLNVTHFSATKKNLQDSHLCPAFEKLLVAPQEHFVLGDARNYTSFKKDFLRKNGRAFNADDVRLLSNFLFLAAKSQGKAFEFSWLSKKEGPIALFWLWYYSNVRKMRLDNISDEENLPHKVVDKVLLLDTVFFRFNIKNNYLTSFFERKSPVGEYLVKRCQLTGDVCREPVKVIFNTNAGASSTVYFEKNCLDLIVKKIGVKEGVCRFTWGAGVFAVSMIKRYSGFVTRVDDQAVLQSVNILKQFKMAFNEKFDNAHHDMPAKYAVALHVVYYSIFEHFGFKRDQILEEKIQTGQRQQFR